MVDQRYGFPPDPLPLGDRAAHRAGMLILPPMTRWLALTVLLSCAISSDESFPVYTARRERDPSRLRQFGRPNPYRHVDQRPDGKRKSFGCHGAYQRIDPDLLFLMETDANWINGLEPVLEGFDHVIRHPKDNHYGMVFASKIPVKKSRIEYLTVSETPTAFAELETEDGTAFRFVGLHPRPPMPGADTDQRDDQLLYSACFARKSGMPVLIMGDFNAVAWSDFSSEFSDWGSTWTHASAGDLSQASMSTVGSCAFQSTRSTSRRMSP